MHTAFGECMPLVGELLCINKFKSLFSVTLWLTIHEIIYLGYVLHFIVLISFCWVINYPKPSGFSQFMCPQILWAGDLGWHRRAVLLIPAGPPIYLLSAASPGEGTLQFFQSLSCPGSCLSPETSPWPAVWVTLTWHHVSQRRQAHALEYKHLCGSFSVTFAHCVLGKADAMISFQVMVRNHY